jgi:hypothetical protein
VELGAVHDRFERVGVVAFIGFIEARGFSWVSARGEVSIVFDPGTVIAQLGVRGGGAAGVVGKVPLGLGDRTLELRVRVVTADVVARWADFGARPVAPAGRVRLLRMIGFGDGHLIGVPIPKFAHD